MRNGVPSANFVAMPSLDGQRSKNFFDSTFTNHPKKPTSFLLKIVSQKFTQASNCPIMVGLNDCATYDSSGNQESNIVFPYEVLFKPTTAASCPSCNNKDDI